MKEVEKLVELKRQIQEGLSEIKRLEARLEQLKLDLPVLEAKWIQTDDEKEGRAIESEMKAAREEIERIPLEIRKIQRKIELLEQKLPRYEEAAIQELRETYLRKLKPLVAELVKCWRLVGEKEREIGELKKQSQLDLVRITSAPRILLPYVPIFFTQADENAVGVGEAGPYYPFSRLRKLIKTLIEEGFNLSLEKND